MSSKRMLIDASHPEETRVVVLSGNRLEEFDHESTAKKQLKGNIYLAKVTRVEPSLQAAFVEYGGNRHGFLPFSEIHPDYYRIPIADRERLIAETADRVRRDEAEDGVDEPEDVPGSDEETLQSAPANENAAEGAPDESGGPDESDGKDESDPGDPATEAIAESEGTSADGGDGNEEEQGVHEEVETEVRVETVGGDEVEEDASKRRSLQQRYKIQEVIKRRQVILVQVGKEERGTKGAALTTYLSLAGRYCVLMPNTARGGGISRKISNANDRRRLKKIISEFEIPEGMAVIVRTAGSQRSKAEIRRDYEYLLRLWDQIRETTLQSTAPAPIHEEANLIKRAIRDLYDRDMDKIEVQGDESYKEAKAFMRSLMPSHARKVQLYRDGSVPLFFRNQVEEQLDAMHQTTVRLRSGGYIVINPTEALVSIDVNSGKATKERHIEETALKTNTEAAEEIARQLRLRDLAGLIVIDFIDMEANRHNRDVERKLKEAMRLDRARIQLGRISPFGLLEMSRQRLRPSLLESSTVPCNLCGGSGHIRSIESSALHLLRALEEEGMRHQGGRIEVKVPTAVALYVLNQKRDRLIAIEQRHQIDIEIERDDGLIAPGFLLDHRKVGKASDAEPVGEDESQAGEAAEQDGSRRKRRRRRPRRQDEAIEASRSAAEDSEDVGQDEPEDEAELATAGARDEGETEAATQRPRRRRGKRGGRRRGRQAREDLGQDAVETPAEPPAPEEAGAAELGSGDLPETADSPEEPPADPKESAPRKPRSRTRRPRSRSSRSRPPESSDETASSGEGLAAGPAAEAPSNGADHESFDRESREQEAPQVAAESSDALVPEPPRTAPLFPHLEPVQDEEREAESAVAEEQSPGEAALDKPKRRGWWNRFVQ